MIPAALSIVFKFEGGTLRKHFDNTFYTDSVHLEVGRSTVLNDSRYFMLLLKLLIHLCLIRTF